MSWTKPKIVDVPCGMEINMYFPAEDERGPGDRLPVASPMAHAIAAKSK